MAPPAPVSGEAGPPDRAVPDLHAHGLFNYREVYANLSPATLTEMAVVRGEGLLGSRGALAVLTGTRTGRSPGDRYVVAEPVVRDEIWWGTVNRPMEPAVFERLMEKVKAYLQGRDLFVTDNWACADPRYRLHIRVIAEKAWHTLFAQCLFLRPTAQERAGFVPQLTIVHASGMQADPAIDGTGSETFIVLSLQRGLVVVGGTHYAGEIKKAVFAVLNYLLPRQGVFPMHCAANIGPKGDTALFFGLSGTGKTTLSADPERRLIGDDEHGWSAEGVFNFEGGQFRGGLLRQDDQPVSGGGAADLERHSLRLCPGERGPRPANAPAGLRGRSFHGKYAGRVPGRLHRQL